MPAFVLVGGCPSKQSLHHKNIANPGVPNETPQALTFSDFARAQVFGPYDGELGWRSTAVAPGRSATELIGAGGRLFPRPAQSSLCGAPYRAVDCTARLWCNG